MPSQTETQLLNEALFEQLGTPGMEKTAIDAVNDYTRTKMREDGFYRRILPPLQISNDELDRQVNTDKPAKVVDKEPDSPAAISIPFATLPINVYIRGPRYVVMFDRIVTPRFTKDVDELRTWVMDIRQVLSDNAIKDMLAEEDSKFIQAVNAVMIGPDVPVPYNNNVVQWETIEGGITRETLCDMLKIMPRGPSHLETHTCLCNNVTVKEIMKFGRDEMGGDFAQDIIKTVGRRPTSSTALDHHDQAGSGRTTRSSCSPTRSSSGSRTSWRIQQCTYGGRLICSSSLPIRRWAGASDMRAGWLGLTSPSETTCVDSRSAFISFALAIVRYT